MATVDRSRVLGITYQDTEGKDGVLLNAPDIKVKLLDSGELTGIIFKAKQNGEETCLSGLNITGVIYQDEDSSREGILTARKVLGIIYQEGTFVDRTILSRSKLLGITYQEAGSSEVKLLGGPQINARILNGSRITGVVYRDNGGVTATSLRDAVLTGLLYKEAAASEEGVLTSLRIVGIIYRDVKPPSRAARLATEKEEPSANGFRKAERFLLYLLPIVGVLGLVLPLILRQLNVSQLSTYVAIVLIVAPVVYLFYLRYRDRTRSATSTA